MSNIFYDAAKDLFYLDPDKSPSTYILHKYKYPPLQRKCLEMQGWEGETARFEWRES